MDMNVTSNKKEQQEAFGRLLEIMDQLRTECPWDKKQTFDSLRTLTIEETHELTEAIASGNMDNIKKELGDLLLHIVFYAKLGSEENAFDINDIIETLCDKLIYRHPHIFSNISVKDSREVEQNWELLKLTEKDGNKSVLAGIPKSLPSLLKAKRIQDKVCGVGFDWDHREQIWEKVTEELNELRKELENEDDQKAEEEFGDFVFSIINAARLYGINPDDALEKTNRKFLKRFGYLEEKTIKSGKSLKDMTLDEMNTYWEEAKKFDE
jgi:MazG family protein